MSPRSAYFEDDSDEGILVMQGSEMRNQRKIVVRQEYMVTRESRDAESSMGWSVAHAEKNMQLGREPSTESEMDQQEVRKNPQQPASVLVKEKRGQF